MLFVYFLDMLRMIHCKYITYRAYVQTACNAFMRIYYGTEYD
ncbi:hypothetical protein TFKS16_2722 [Tannerella forsythia KS16]|uniref:Uncharacterized protein n=1 Tax=Tannerella forsythia (strain ATCC 43037 / JCM 10827 / CCUG 21028 A / KCTC 5666 / FDC 338) TaxID=203275 RepID=G8UPT1_TANFA|nr:hypothetical protein BFO_3003 [Tannerella forsythia 92A2]BAR52900.1 hypothetical protein TFKS16_2722 [Tannerella forsythia KS16]